MPTVRTIAATVQTVIVPLLIDRRLQVVAAIAFALTCGLLLGPDGVDAREGAVGGGGHRP